MTRAYDLETPAERQAKAASREQRLAARRLKNLAKAEALLINWQRKAKRAKRAINKLNKQLKYLRQVTQ